MIRFKFNIDKAISAVLYISKNLSRPDLHKISKVLYFAEQKHLSTYGSPIIGDCFVAMDNGPVPSQIYDMLKTVRGDSLMETDDYKPFFRVEKSYFIIPLVNADLNEFSESELECLNVSLEENKDLGFNELKAKSHGMAYDKASLNSTISFENMAIEGGANEDMINFLKEKSQFVNHFE
jgi:uncharacterized phage-associated protein